MSDRIDDHVEGRGGAGALEPADDSPPVDDGVVDDGVADVDDLAWLDEYVEPAAAAAAESRAAGDVLVDERPERVDERPLDDEEGSEQGSQPAPWWERAWRRALRRPIAWATAPWPRERVVKVLVTGISLVVTTVIMANVVHLRPLFAERDLIFDDNTPTGGDFGAHVWGPAFLRDHLLGSFRLNGWSMDWYAGMPAYRFYMVLPALAIVALDVIAPYGVAMKVVAVSGLVTLPAACWAFGRLGRFAYPIPELFAFAGLAFALDESFSIYGGNLKSTMAGEFSFSIALSLGVLGLGLLSAGMRTGKYRVWTAVVLAAAGVSHGIVLIFVSVSALVIALAWFDRRSRVHYALTTGITTVLLMAWWVGPFLFGHEYMTDMKYGFRPRGADDSFWDMFFPLAAPLDVLITGFALAGVGAVVLRRHRTGIALSIIGVVFVALVYLTRDSLPVIGLLWNPRLLPFVYLVRYLLMMVGIVAVATAIWNVVRDRRAGEPMPLVASTATAVTTAVAVLVVLGWVFQVLPGAGIRSTGPDGAQVYAWGPFRATATATDAQGDGWARYNFSGYEGRGSFYTEYEGVVRTMEAIGDDPQLGCGRALWENSADNGQYGTTMALMLLPHWTDGCIGSMEGLFFEASGTTPYHFLTTAAMSKQSSNPVRELRYVDNDASIGVRHLQDLGVRYVMVRTPEAQAEAAAQPELTLVATSGPWEIYLVADSDVVVPLTTQPVVVAERSGDQRERHLELGTSWFQQPEEWVALPADSGPDAWQRIEAVVDADRVVGVPGESGRRVDIVVPAEQIEPVALPSATVSDVDIGQQSLRFSVDQVGVPVLVKVSYFPNWDVSGADGPYRVAPNFMVVVPTDTEVELTYGRSGADYLFSFLTLVGIGLCVLWRLRGDVDVSDDGAAPTGEPPSHDDDQTDALAGSSQDPSAVRPADEPHDLDEIWAPTVPTPATVAPPPPPGPDDGPVTPPDR